MGFVPLYPKDSKDVVNAGFKPSAQTGVSFDQSRANLAQSQNLFDQMVLPKPVMQSEPIQMGGGFMGKAGQVGTGIAKGLGQQFVDTAEFVGQGATGLIPGASMIPAPMRDLTNIPGVQQGLQGAEELLEADTPLEETAKTGTEWGTAILGLLGGGSAVASRIPKLGNFMKEIGMRLNPGKRQELAKLLEDKESGKLMEFALDFTKPRVTRATGTEAIQQGRFVEPGLLSKSSLTPTPRDNLVAESVMDVITPDKKMSENIEQISQKISQTNQGVREMIAARKSPFNGVQLRSKLEANKADNQLVFASDAMAEKTYDAVIEEFMKHMDKKDTLGLFEARQSFDKVPAIKKLLENEKLGEHAKRDIVLDVRRAANEYISDLLPENNPYKKAMKEETRMLEALGNIADTNFSKLDKNKLQLLAEEYPMLKWFVSGLAGAGGIGVGSTIIQSTD
jgi:hypothetical protein